MNSKPIFLLLTLVLLSGLLRAQVGIDQWRDHLSYHQVKQLCMTENDVYAAANHGIYHYDRSDRTINRHNKTTDLNDVGIATMAYDEVSRYLVVAYDNANIDLMYDDRVFNISDLKRNMVLGDKRINHIRFDNRRAYLACAFGIVVVDLDRHEIENTYYLGTGGTTLPVNDVAFVDSLIVAATSNGMQIAHKNDPFLNVDSRWWSDTTSILRDLPIATLEMGNGTVMALTPEEEDTPSAIFNLTFNRQQPEVTTTLPWLTGNIRSMHCCDGKWVVCFYDSVNVYDSQYRCTHNFAGASWLSVVQANDAWLTSDATLWIAHDWAGMISFNLNTGQLDSHTPSGPHTDQVYRLVPNKDCMLLCAGGKTSTYTNAYILPSLSLFRNEQWSASDNSAISSEFWDLLDVAVNPKNDTLMLATSWGYGLVKFNGTKAVTLYNNENTEGTLQPYTNTQGFSSLRLGAVVFDDDGNAWMTNSLVDNGLVVRRNDGSWESFATRNMVQNNELDKIVWDSIRDYKWFAGRANRIYVHDGNNLMAYVDPNNGSKLETSSVNCLVQDHHGDLWIGTNKGLKLITNGYQAFNNGGTGELSPVTCLNITISNNEFAEYLMAYENVTCIAVDGANRKWVGTASGGLYLISANGTDELQHFTAANSPLFSDKILCLGIQPQTGELFIGTEQGLQSYRGTATYASYYPDNDIHAFPNPVEPGYDGPIAIKGFTRNALVHITDAAGHVVFSTTANGGQAIWNGRTNNGVRVTSGVYFVFASDESGSMRSVAKVMIIR